MADGSRNNPADVHRTSRTSLQFHHNNRHNVSHPIPKHTDKSQHRTPHHNPRTPKKKPEGCAEGPWLYGPFAVFSHSNVIYPLRGPQPMCHTAGVPQSMRYIRRGLRNLYYATIYPTEIYKVPFDTFRLSVELPIQKHTGTS